MRSIFLSAGHSLTDPGAVAFGRKEADVAVDFRTMVAFYLRRAGLGAYLTLDGEGPENLPLGEAIEIARKHDLSVEFHCNASANPAATGVETLSGPVNAPFGSRMCQAIAAELRIRNRGAKSEGAGQHSRLGFVSKGGGVILELFFLTNPDDLAAYDARKWLAARAVAEVIAREAGA